MHKAEAILHKIWEALFSAAYPQDLQQFQKEYCSDIQIPVFQESLSGGNIVASARLYSRVIDQQDLDRFAPSDLQVATSRGDELDTIIDAALEDFNFCASNIYNSSDVTLSDNIYGSLDIHCSRAIHNSQHVILSANSIGLEFAAACENSGYSQFVVRIMDSINCCRCYEVYQSGKCSNAYYISNCYDVHDSILCYNLRSKRYCIGNRQFDESTYHALKAKALQRLTSKQFRPLYELLK